MPTDGLNKQVVNSNYGWPEELDFKEAPEITRPQVLKRIISIISQSDLKDLYSSQIPILDSTIALLEHNQNDEPLIANNIKQFFEFHWQQIKNTAFAYSYAPHTELNGLCLWLAMTIDKERPHCVLMPDRIGKVDGYLSKFEDLDFCDFITTPNGGFIVIADVIEGIYERYAAGESDVLNYIDSKGKILPLTTLIQNTIVNRFPALHTFFKIITDDIQKNKTRKKPASLLTRLQDLRQALLENDALHNGTELAAGESVNVHIVAFYQLYQSLPVEERTWLDNLQDAQNNLRLGSILQRLFRYDKKKEMGVYYCIQISGRQIEQIIDDNKELLAEKYLDQSFIRLRTVYNDFCSVIRACETEQLTRIMHLDDSFRFAYLINSAIRSSDSLSSVLNEMYLQAIYYRARRIAHLIEQSGLLTNIRACTYKDRHVMHYAIQDNNLSSVRFMLSLDISLLTLKNLLNTIITNDSYSVLSYFVTRGVRIPHFYTNILARIINEKKSKILMAIYPKLNPQRIPEELIIKMGLWLCSAVRLKQFNLCSALLYLGADPNPYKDNQYNSPLHFSLRHNRSLAIQLIEHGADPFLSDIEGQTPLEMASESGMWELIELMLTCYCKELTDSQKQILGLVLLDAVHADQTQISLLLIKLGATTYNYFRENSETALHRALTHRNETLIHMLIKNDAPCFARNSIGESPIQIAVDNKNWSLVRKMLESIDALCKESVSIYGEIKAQCPHLPEDIMSVIHLRSFSLLTLKTEYKKHYFGLSLRRFSLFKSGQEEETRLALIRDLQERANIEPNGASAKTLNALDIPFAF